MYDFFYNDTATTEIYTLSLHDALPICGRRRSWSWTCSSRDAGEVQEQRQEASGRVRLGAGLRLGLGGDRKSTRLNSSHSQISYAVFCLKKKKDKLKTSYKITSQHWIQ